MKHIFQSVLLLILSTAAWAEESALFNGYGNAVAYVVTDDGLTITFM